MSDFRHCEPVTDVTGVAIRTPSGQIGIKYAKNLRCQGEKRIATPVCALARNDRPEDCSIIYNLFARSNTVEAAAVYLDRSE